MSDNELEHVEMAEDMPSPGATPPSESRRSIIHDNENEDDGLEDGEKPLSRVMSGDHVDLHADDQSGGDNEEQDMLVETMIEWKQGGNQVYVTGSFTGWRQMIPLTRVDGDVFVVVLRLSPGVHRLRFVVDGELRCSDSMSTATDSMGNLVNYMQVQPPPTSEYTQWEDERPAESKIEYSRDIPEIFVNPEALDRLASHEFTTPPQLPPHLDGVILNTNWNEKDNNSVLPVPNHVVLNHLATTSIRHNVLAVASVSRFQDKFVTQILYTPL